MVVGALLDTTKSLIANFCKKGLYFEVFTSVVKEC